MTSGYCLDAGALIAVERGQRGLLSLLRDALQRRVAVDVPAGVVAQVWRGGARQSRVARLLRAEGVVVAELDRETAHAVGTLCGLVGASDVIDGHVAWHALRHDLAVITSDPDDIRAFGAHLEIVTI